MLTSSLSQLVEIEVTISEDLTKPSQVDATIRCLQSGGTDAWYGITETLPPEVVECNDEARIREFLQDILLGWSETLEKKVTGIRMDPHGLLDFLLPANAS